MSIFYGDSRAFVQAIVAFNERLNSKPDAPGGLYIADPIDFEDTRRTDIYLQTVRHLLKPTPTGGKRLILGECQRLRGHLQALPVVVPRVEDYPAVAALGYAAHTLVASMPWLEFARPERFIPTIQGDMEALDLWPMENADHFETDERDSDMVETIAE